MTTEKENTSYIETEDGKVVKISDYKKQVASRRPGVAVKGNNTTERKRTDRS